MRVPHFGTLLGVLFGGTCHQADSGWIDAWTLSQGAGIDANEGWPLPLAFLNKENRVNGQWINTKINLVFPLELTQQDENSVAIVDQAGDTVCEVITEGVISDIDRARMKFLLGAANGRAGLGISRVRDFQAANKPCESEWEPVDE